MMIKKKNLRAYLRGWCKRAGVEYNRQTWIVRKHLGR